MIKWNHVNPIFTLLMINPMVRLLEVESYSPTVILSVFSHYYRISILLNRYGLGKEVWELGHVGPIIIKDFENP